MRPRPAPDIHEPWLAWREAADQPTIDAALRDLYARLDAEIARRGPTCWTSGRCCHFEAYGHRLYVTGLEIAWFLSQLSLPERPASPAASGVAHVSLPQLGSEPQPARRDVPAEDGAAALPPACRYLVAGKCSTHAVRPLGCRIFFCQAGTEAWQSELYEQYLDELRRLHDGAGLPYRYMEWRAGLIEADAAFSDAAG